MLDFFFFSLGFLGGEIVTYIRSRREMRKGFKDVRLHLVPRDFHGRRESVCVYRVGFNLVNAGSAGARNGNYGEEDVAQQRFVN